MRHDDEKEVTEPDETTEAAEAAGDEECEQLDLSKLDLTVETVEERISPSETNVFDK